MNVVLSVLHQPVFGGPHNQLLRLREPLSALGWKTVVVLPSTPGEGSGRLRAAGIEVHQIPLHRPRKSLHPGPHLDLLLGFWPEIAALRRLIRKRNVALVQVFGPMNLHGAVAGCLEGVPVVWQLLGTFAPPLVRRLLMPAVVRMADVVMTTGIEIGRLHPGTTSLGPRWIPFYPPVDTNRFRPETSLRMRARDELGIPPEGLLVGTVGNFNWSKGHDSFVRAAFQVHQKLPNTFFRILGAKTPTQISYYNENVVSLAAQLGLTGGDCLRFVEPGDRVVDLLPAFDLFVLTSRAEGIPTAILEAMACSVPVVAVQVGGVHEIVEDGRTGRLLSSSSPEAVSNAILKLLGNLPERLHMGTVARRRAVEKYDTQVCAATHASAYEMATRSALAGRRGSSPWGEMMNRALPLEPMPSPRGEWRDGGAMTSSRSKPNNKQDRVDG